MLAEYSPRVTGMADGGAPAAAALGPGPVRRANVNPHLHYPVDEELQRQLDLGAVALKIHPVHAGFAVNDRALYPAYEICQALGLPVVVHCGTSTFPGALNQFADPILLDDVLRDFRGWTGARARRARLVVRRRRLPGAVERTRVDRAVRPAAVPAARRTTPGTTGPASPGA